MRLEQRDNTVLLHVKVVPNSSRTQLAGQLGDALKIKVAQPPEDGKANRAVEQLLAETLNLPKSSITVIAGHTRPQKTIQITGLSPQQIETRLSLK